VLVAPSSRARSSRASRASTATICDAPAATEPITAARPVPPNPNTATRSPGRTPAVRHTAHTPLATAQPTRAATSNGTSAGMRTHERSGTTARSANDERKQ
jgi:hypothetical protein